MCLYVADDVYSVLVSGNGALSLDISGAGADRDARWQHATALPLVLLAD